MGMSQSREDRKEMEEEAKELNKKGRKVDEEREIIEMANINNLLPTEIIEKIFHLLPPKVLMIAMLVCRRWLEVGETPVLWTRQLHLNSRNILSMLHLLKTRRML